MTDLVKMKGSSGDSMIDFARVKGLVKVRGQDGGIDMATVKK